jgi:hypothetical protein
MTHPAVNYSGPHGFTNLKTHRGDPSICPEGDTLYPSHAWDACTDQDDGAEWVCAACGIRAVDMDEGGVKLVPCPDCAEEPAFCGCDPAHTAGQR